MTHDPLAQFRKTPAPPQGDMASPSEAEGYVAFGTKDRVRRLRIRSRAGLVTSPGYNILLSVVSDGEKGSHFILVFTILMVRVQGRNLQKLVFALENDMVDFIEEFDSEKWPKPTDANAPLIESIEIRETERGSSNMETQH